MAAGLTIRRERLDEFRERFGGIARETLGPDDLGPEQRVDLELGLREATRELERLCRHLEPCGAGNASPVFGVRGVRFAGRSRVGNGPPQGRARRRRHAAPAPSASSGPTGCPGWATGPVDAAFRLECNEWNGHSTLQARLCALSPRAPRDAGRRRARARG